MQCYNAGVNNRVRGHTRTFRCLSTANTAPAVAILIAAAWIFFAPMFIGHDAESYLLGAVNIHAGSGYTNQWGPITHWPPLFSMLIAALMMLGLTAWAAAKIIVGAAFGATALMVWNALRGHSPAVRAALAAVVMHASAWVYGGCWSETVFLPITLGAIMAAQRFVQTETRRSMLAVIALLSLCILCRWVGGAIVAGVCAYLLIALRGSVIRRLLRVCAIGMIAAILPMAWIVRNLTVAENATNRHAEFRPIPLYQLQTFFGSWAEAFYHGNPAFIFDIIVGGLIVLAMVAIHAWRRCGGIINSVYLIGTASYVLLLLVSVSTFDHSTPLDIRLLIPAIFMLTIGTFNSVRPAL